VAARTLNCLVAVSISPFFPPFVVFFIAWLSSAGRRLAAGLTHLISEGSNENLLIHGINPAANRLKETKHVYKNWPEYSKYGTLENFLLPI
jgi:hypothetical protein